MNDPAGPRREDPHRGQWVAKGGASLAHAKAAMIKLHGRGASAESLLTLADVLMQPDVAYIAPRAGVPIR